MYEGNNPTGAAVGRSRLAPPDSSPTPVEQLSSISDATGKNLQEAREALDILLGKVRGAQPQESRVAGEKGERTVINDAYMLRELSGAVLARVHELHRVIGHDH